MTHKVPNPSIFFPAEPTEPTVNYCDGFPSCEIRAATAAELAQPLEVLYSERTGSRSKEVAKVAKCKRKRRKQTIDLTFLLDESNHEQLLSKWNEMPRCTARKFSDFLEFEGGKGGFANLYADLTIYWYRTKPQILEAVAESGRDREFPLNAAPVAPPFRKPERKKVWDDFISLFNVTERSDIHELTDYDS